MTGAIFGYRCDMGGGLRLASEKTAAAGNAALWLGVSTAARRSAQSPPKPSAITDTGRNNAVLKTICLSI